MSDSPTRSGSPTGSDSSATAPLRCPTCGAPLGETPLRPGQTVRTCAYCGTTVPVGDTPRPPLIRVTSGNRPWLKGGWAGDPRIWWIFIFLVLGLVWFLVFTNFGPT